MAVETGEALSNIERYAAEVRNAHGSQMELDMRDSAAFEAHLDRTIEELRARVNEQQAALQKLKAAASDAPPQAPSADPRERLRQLHVIKSAYERLTTAEPALPQPDSLLPALLATRTIQQTISSTRLAITADQERLASTEQRLQLAEARLRDANLLTSRLESRIERLRAQQLEKPGRSPSQKAKDLIDAQQKRVRSYEHETERLRSAMYDFIDEHLAGMLAAEQLGGPVVGDLKDVDKPVLATGFSHHGKPRTLSGATNKDHNDKKQKRIDEMLKQAGDEQETATKEIRGLIDELLEALLGDEGPGRYVQLEHDSATARFLVRAKVAQFHPKDARKLRLIDFGRELDD